MTLSLLLIGVGGGFSLALALLVLLLFALFCKVGLSVSVVRTGDSNGRLFVFVLRDPVGLLLLTLMLQRPLTVFAVLQLILQYSAG